MENRDGEIHVETDEARGATNNNIVRWVLLISLFGAIVLLSIIWITGAATQGDEEQNVEVTSRAQEVSEEQGSEGTDSIVGEDADELETADDAATGTVENEAADEPSAETEAN
jgi:hypothetical protein